VEEAALAAVAVLGERAEGSEQLLRCSPQLVAEVAAKALGRTGAGDIRSGHAGKVPMCCSLYCPMENRTVFSRQAHAIRGGGRLLEECE